MNPIESAIVTPEEEESWKDLELQKHNKALAELHEQARIAATRFIEDHSTAELGIYTLRKAFEIGFRHGIMYKKEQDDA
jgi:hypothetical protein